MPEVENRGTVDTIEIVDENLKHGFAQLPRSVLKAKGLTFRAKLLYVALLDYAWQKGSCFPGHATLAEDLDTSHDTVRRALLELRDYGLVKWTQQGLNRPNVYYLLRLKECPRLGLAEEEDAKLRLPDNADLRLQDNAKLRHKEYSSKNTHSISKYSKAKASLSKPKEPVGDDREHRGLTAVGAVLAKRQPVRSSEALRALDPHVAELISSWSHEWRDDLHLRSNLTQARHIQDQCGWGDEAFISSLYQAHATTVQDGDRAVNKMAYFFAVLRDAVGAELIRPQGEALSGG
jgi:hypothetical protein